VSPIGLGHVHGHEFYTTFHQAADEIDIARQPVELGDKQRCLSRLERLWRL
jgi:hypothetical protein